ncbi:uncharacterized protein [Penaeus vannamei]|uniref:uncharacterized protein isoform X2 n=1 Tax=Penaeus vannamei TaxID=6689 RepID=UPI00387F8EB6
MTLTSSFCGLCLSCSRSPSDDGVEEFVVTRELVEGDMDNAGPQYVPRSRSQQGAQTPCSSSVPRDYRTFPDPRNDQSFANVTASPSEEDKKSFVRGAQTPCSSSVPRDYRTFPDPRSEQSFAKVTAPPSEEDEKGFVRGTQTPGSSSYPGDYWPSTDPRNKQSFPDPAASPSEEDEKGFVQTHQESKILEENAVTKQQEGFEPRTACLPDSKDKEISSPSHQHYGADRDNISAEKRNPSMPFPASPSAEEHQFKSHEHPQATDPQPSRAPTKLALEASKRKSDGSHEHPQATDPQPSRAPTKLALEASKRKSDGETYQETLRKKARKSSGLPNLGNTCYMNSVLQCLYHTTELTEFLLSEDGRSNTNAGPVTKAFTELLKRMKKNANPKFELRELKRVVGERDPEFAGSRQREAHDFLAMMQTWLSKELEEDTEDLKIKDITIPNLRPSFPVELFNGIHCSTFICERKNRVFLRKYEPFSNLTLAVTSMSSNMEDVLKRYYESQMITWTCKLCQEDHECRHDTRIYRLPRVLIVHFSRYNLSAIGTSRKAVVYCPPVLKLDSYLHSDVKRGQEYELYASCTHQGRMTGGHYIAHHMDPSGKWTLFDDSYVEHDVEANIDKAHILFYRARRMDLVTHLSELGPQS